VNCLRLSPKLFIPQRFTPRFERDSAWWIGYVEELPGTNTQGATIEEARENLREAIELILEANEEIA
jgi:predicted RNase H-like HicB family nuclease